MTDQNDDKLDEENLEFEDRTIFVDSGCIWIGDPCNAGKISEFMNDPKKINSEFGNKVVHTEPNGEGMGVLIKTAFGDGPHGFTVVYEDGKPIQAIIDLQGEIGGSLEDLIKGDS